MPDSIETISDPEGFYYTRLLAARHGLLVGSSSGAALQPLSEKAATAKGKHDRHYLS